MSSTNRGADRAPNDDYPTPFWCVHRLLEARPLPGRVWSEPCAGAGSIIRAVNETRSDLVWLANEINPTYESSLRAIPNVYEATIGDARSLSFKYQIDVIITNPPFVYAEEILHRCLLVPRALTIFLQRLNWCGGPRAALFRKLKPSVYVLADRPSFKESWRLDKKTGKLVKSTTDSTEYAWFVFDGLGKFEVLDNTPAAVRKAEKAARKSAGNLEEKISNITLDTVPVVGLTVTPANENEEAGAVEDEIESRSIEVVEAVESSQVEAVNTQQESTKMAWLPQNMAAAIANSKASVGRERTKDGDYILLHKKCSYEKTQKGMALIIEHRVVEAKKLVEGVDPNAVGTDVSYFLPDYGPAAVMLQPNVKGYVLNLLGLSEDKVDTAELIKAIEAMGDERQIARGMLIRAVTFHTPKKSDGEDFMGFNFHPVPGENNHTLPSVIKRRAELDAGAAAAPPAAAPTNGQTASPLPPPPLPAAPSLPPPPKSHLDGWTPYPNTPGYFYKGQDVKTEAQILAMATA